jgi:hypothetical protein
LALLSQGGFQLRQGRAGAHRHHQLAGLVADDAVQTAGVQNSALQLQGMKVFAAAPANAQWRRISNGSAYALKRLVKGGIHGLNRSRLTRICLRWPCEFFECPP